MSRTYRRRKDSWDIPRHDYKFQGHVMVEIFIAKGSEQYKEKKVQYHQDGKHGFKSAPRWYVNMFRERPLRRKTKKALHQWMRHGGEVIIPLFVHDAAWNYW